MARSSLSSKVRGFGLLEQGLGSGGRAGLARLLETLPEGVPAGGLAGVPEPARVEFHQIAERFALGPILAQVRYGLPDGALGTVAARVKLRTLRWITACRPAMRASRCRSRTAPLAERVCRARPAAGRGAGIGSVALVLHRFGSAMDEIEAALAHADRDGYGDHHVNHRRTPLHTPTRRPTCR